MTAAEKNKSALLVASGAPLETALVQRIAIQSGFIAAVDGGYRYCGDAGITPDVLIGDLDSLGFEPRGDVPVIRLPREKDDTDTLYAARWLLGQGYRRMTLACALGGRLDHTLANLCVLSFLAEQGVTASIVDGISRAQVLLPGRYPVPRVDGQLAREYRLFSLLPFGDACTGVMIEGARYPLRDARLENSYPLGVSNEFLDADARIAFTSGKLLLIRSVGDA